MTTQLFPSIIASPFSRHLDTRQDIFRGSRAACLTDPAASSTSLAPFIVHQDHDLPSESVLSDASAPTQTNNENYHSPAVDALLPKSSHSTSAHPLSNRPKVLSESRNHFPAQHIPVYSNRTRQALTELHNEEKRVPGLHNEFSSRSRGRSKLNPSSCTEPTSTRYRRQEISTSRLAGGTQGGFGSLDPSHQSSVHTSAPFPLDVSEDALELVEPPTIFHKKRNSNASSGFVHTMKTASISNASFSLIPRSLRIGRSTDSSYIFASHARHSTESDRPPTSASMDEAAFRRGIRRRQIVGELITTEESYIADLKALIYLYSTLLATAMSIPSTVRSSIMRNVHDLLHIHERLLEQLHHAAYEAAARRWADTHSPRNLGSPRQHRRWRSLESNVAIQYSRSHRRIRSSMESSEVARGRPYLGCSEPKDVSDVAAIFKGSMNDFLAYEEYCANHSLVAHDLQRHAPTLWSTYESGMESLARSIVALDHKRQNERKGLTVGDLLIKPIQRMTKYPLLFEDLLKQTPVADCPSSHTDVDAVLQCLKEVVQTVNEATDNHETRTQIQRRWSLQTKLTYRNVSLKAAQLRLLGNVQLCGVLHVTWQTRTRIDGCYALCILFDSSLVIAFPVEAIPKFEVVAFLHLSDVRVESASDCRGLQCHSTLHTWKICFEVSGHLHEFMMSACSTTEENAWKDGMQNKDVPKKRTDDLFNQIPSSIAIDLRSIGMVYSQQNPTLSRNPSVQRAATVGNRANVCQVIIRNTHNPQDLHEFRQPSSSAINRSQSHMTSNRIVVLSPKRSERARLESNLSDVWTKEKLPYPGLIGSRGGQIIRASAGSLVRKLSLASIHAPFSRRSGSLSLASRKSFDAPTEGRRDRIRHPTPVFEVRKQSFDELTPARKKSHDLPELDTMDSVISRMIGGSGSKRLSFTQGDGSLLRRGTRSRKNGPEAASEVGPEDPAEIFYSEAKENGMGPEKLEIVEEGLAGRKKRWSNPLGILKVLSADGFRHMMYSTNK